MTPGATEGTAVVYCEGAFGTPNGKTAHGLIRRSGRYRVAGVIDSRCAGREAAAVLGDGCPGIPIYADIQQALHAARNPAATHLVIGLAPDGGRLPAQARDAISSAIRHGLNVDSGLHDFLTEDTELLALARAHGVVLRDIRKPPPRSSLHSFSGAIERVTSTRVALLGTDSAVGKRTTAWLLVDALSQRALRAELIGTGQTAWLQGASYGITLDALINDFVAGELEHAIVSCFDDQQPDVMVLEGQGSLMNPAYPGGLEILAAGRPQAVVLQHAPARRDYDGFPGYRVHPLRRQIEAIQILSDRPVIAVTVNKEHLSDAEARAACRAIESETALPCCEPLAQGVGSVVEALFGHEPQLSHRAGP